MPLQLQVSLFLKASKMIISYHMGQLNGHELHPSAHILFKNKKKALKKETVQN